MRTDEIGAQLRRRPREMPIEATERPIISPNHPADYRSALDFFLSASSSSLFKPNRSARCLIFSASSCV